VRSVPGLYDEDQLPLCDNLETAVRRVEVGVRWPSACEDVIPVAEECPLLSQLRAGVVRSEKRVAGAGDSSGTQRRGTSAVKNRYQATASED
jgi:hypothetical protein